MYRGMSVFACVMLMLLIPASCVDAGLIELLYSYDDPLMTSLDLAFLLVTHGYNATPADGCVVVVAGNSTYMLVPNGDKPGLADLSDSKSSSLTFN
ncbi:MAG: hypothetical protein NQU42_06420 [Methanothrix sp.]|uniref:hypothetical protein n=1 Tax=Methanothrix sp. TaxID=90426 RepID=UPI0025D430C0|nr:hypothetical protein [Methanothrix sp.]MCQ8903709.1 hypothetical protein [Methanothrix sp.]